MSLSKYEKSFKWIVWRIGSIIDQPWTESSPQRFFVIRDLPYLKAGIQDFKTKWGWDSELRTANWLGMRDTENSLWDDGIERKFGWGRWDWKPLGNPSEQHFAKDLAWENGDNWRHHHWFHQFEGKPVQCSLFSITCPQVAANVWRRHQIWFSFSVSIVYLNLNLILKGSFLNPINNEIVLAIRGLRWNLNTPYQNYDMNDENIV